MNFFYIILRAGVRLCLQIYFKNVKCEELPSKSSGQARLLAVNHPSSFLDACLLACWLDGPLYFLVRGDVFHPSLRWFFRLTYQIPIYRFRDGFKNLRSNESSFRKCHETLAQGGSIVIFSEGLTEYEKRLRPIQRGTARLAFGTLEDFPQTDLIIQPVGINYENTFLFRSSVDIQMGNPLIVKPYLDRSDGIKALTQDITFALRQVVIHIEKRERELIFECMAYQAGLFNGENGPSFRTQLNLVDKVNSLSEEEAESILREISIIPFDLLLRYPLKGRKPPDFLKLKYFLLQSVYGVMYLLYYGPALLARQLSKYVMNHPSFRPAVTLGIAFFLYIIQAIAIFFILYGFVSLGAALGIVILWSALGLYYPGVWDLKQKYRMFSLWRKQKKDQRVQKAASRIYRMSKKLTE